MLFLDIDLAHVNFARNAHQGAGRGQRHAVLACAGFSDDFFLAHEFGQQRLAQAVVDFVRPGVVEVFALEVDLRSAQLLRQAAGVKNGAGAAHIVGKQLGQFILKVLPLGDFSVGGVDGIHGLFEVGRDELAAVGAKKSLGIGHRGKRGGSVHGESQRQRKDEKTKESRKADIFPVFLTIFLEYSRPCFWAFQSRGNQIAINSGFY